MPSGKKATIDLEEDVLLTLREAAERAGVKTISAVWKWAHRGRNGHQLPALRFGRFWLTTARWLDEFLEESGRGRPGAGTSPR